MAEREEKWVESGHFNELLWIFSFDSTGPRISYGNMSFIGDVMQPPRGWLEGHDILK